MVYFSDKHTYDIHCFASCKTDGQVGQVDGIFYNLNLARRTNVSVSITLLGRLHPILSGYISVACLEPNFHENHTWHPFASVSHPEYL